MKFREIEIKNYRSLEHATVSLENLTVLIGANNAGKTSVLDAIDLFSSSERKIGADDFNDREKDVEMVLTMECQKGEGSIPERFCINGELTIKKIYRLSGDKVELEYSARVLLNSEFGNLRKYALSKEIKSEIKRLSPTYRDLPAYGKNKAKWRERFHKYDERYYLNHPDDPKVQEHYVRWDIQEIPLEQLLEIIYVPSMRDITNDGVDGSGSYLTKLIGMAIEDAQSSDPLLKAAVNASVSDYGEYVKALKATVIKELNKSLVTNSSRYVGNSAIKIKIVPPRQVLPRPTPSMVISERDQEFSIEQAGGGTRRVYLMALLETLSERQSKRLSKKRGARAKLIMIDEPELYQHPQRQRHILLTISRLAHAKKNAVQVVCSTHSPYFIELRQIAGLRLLQRGHPTRILHTTLDSLARRVPLPKKPTSQNDLDRLRTWLDMNATHWMTEGFFSRRVVIMEGPGDRNMLLATASVMGVNLNQYEMSLVPTSGKPKIPGIVQIFRTFEIPTYVIWDLDYRPGNQITDEQRKRNARIMKLASEENYTKYANLEQTEINSSFSCFGDNLTASLVEDLESCEGALADMNEYKELQKAKKRDAGTPKEKPYMQSQKHVLNSKETVFSMLMAIREKEPKRLDRFTTAIVVRQLEKIGKDSMPMNT